MPGKPLTPREINARRRRKRLAALAKKPVKGGALGESLHKRATDPREARPLLLGTPSLRQPGRFA